MIFLRFPIYISTLNTLTTRLGHFCDNLNNTCGRPVNCATNQILELFWPLSIQRSFLGFMLRRISLFQKLDNKRHTKNNNRTNHMCSTSELNTHSHKTWTIFVCVTFIHVFINVHVYYKTRETVYSAVFVIKLLFYKDWLRLSMIISLLHTGVFNICTIICTSIYTNLFLFRIW